MKKLVTIFILFVLIAWPFAAMAQADLIFKDGFESGDFSAWSSVNTGGGDLTVSTEAKLTGNYGVQAVINDTAIMGFTDDSPNNETRYRFRFYFDPNSITMSNAEMFALIRIYQVSATILELDFRKYNGNYELSMIYNHDTGWGSTSYVAMTDAPHILEFDWKSATAVGANDGYLTIWIDGVQVRNNTNIDNDTRRIDRITMGAISGMDAGTSGTIYFDAFESRRDSYIGPEPEPTPTPDPNITPTPAHLAKVNLSSGSVLNIERSISYGDIAEIMAVMLIVVIYAVTVVIRTMDK